MFIGSRAVLEDRDPLAIVLADTEVDRSPVANRPAAVTPLATHLSRHALGVNIVLGGGGLALPLVVLRGGRAGQGFNGLGVGTEGDSLRFSAC